VYEWKIAKWNTVFYEYFKNREDDDLSEDVRVTVTRTS
jgi:hypothetical protein